MKKILFSLFIFSSISASAHTDFKCTTHYPNQTPDERVTYIRANDDGSLCTLYNGNCYLDIREAAAGAKDTALLIDGMGVKILNVPTGFRDLESFRGLEKLSSSEPHDLLLIESEVGVYKMGCVKIRI